MVDRPVVVPVGAADLAAADLAAAVLAVAVLAVAVLEVVGLEVVGLAVAVDLAAAVPVVAGLAVGRLTPILGRNLKRPPRRPTIRSTCGEVLPLSVTSTLFCRGQFSAFVIGVRTTVSIKATRRPAANDGSAPRRTNI